MAPEETLGRALLRTLQDLDALIPKAKVKDLPALRRKRKALLKRIEDLVEANLDKGSEEYAAATASLQDASATIREAIANIARVTKAIEVLGQALEIVARLAAAA
jgi:hypothetical protein